MTAVSDNYRRVAFIYYLKDNSSLDKELMSALNKLLDESKIKEDFSKKDLKLKVDNIHKQIYTLVGSNGNMVYMIDKYDNSYSASLFSEVPKHAKVSKEEAMKKIVDYLERKSR